MKATLLSALLLVSGAGTVAGLDTPAERAIARARTAVEARPEHAPAHNQLALALSRRARETADGSWYDRSDEVLTRSLELAPGNYEAQKLQVWNLLGRHEFGAARERAEELNRVAPDDVLVYGFLVDACVELGDFAAAEDAAQWMLDLRPGNVPGLTRAAYLRELFGDVEGALQLLIQAYQSLPAQETEDRAWVLTHVAHIYTSTGRRTPAEEALERALELFPDYHYALAELAEVRAGQGRHAEAVEILRRRYAVAAHPENLYELAVALRKAGEEDEALELFARFEADALAESESVDNANGQLVAYYLDHAPAGEGGAARALALTERELGRRGDVHTRHAHARALHAAGRHAEAREVIEGVLAVGLRDATMLYHAGLIARDAGDAEAGRRYLRESLRADPASPVAEDARRESYGVRTRGTAWLPIWH